MVSASTQSRERRSQDRHLASMRTSGMNLPVMGSNAAQAENPAHPRMWTRQLNSDADHSRLLLYQMSHANSSLCTSVWQTANYKLYSESGSLLDRAMLKIWDTA